MLNQRTPRIDNSRFAMIPRSGVPRSRFNTRSTHKTTFDAGYLVPIYVDEVLPGDVHKIHATVFARLQPLLFPLMDHLSLETFFFFVPMRILWANFKKFMGEQDNPGDSISYLIPTVTSPLNGWVAGSLADYFGLPVVGQVTGGNTVTHSVLPLRAYNKIWNDWFRDENLQPQQGPTTADGPDSSAAYVLLRRNKKHDYFTSALPYPLKGGVDVTLPMSGNAPVKGIAITATNAPTAGGITAQENGGSSASGWPAYYSTNAAGTVVRASSTSTGSAPNIYADLTTATGATLNALRLAAATQRMLEANMRGGTRYTEILQNIWGVDPQDMRLQRPEYIGGGRTDIQTSAIPQTSATSGSNALGQLAAQATGADRHHATLYAQEHGYVIGLIHVTPELTYQQGLARLWTRSTALDFYRPEFAYLGEQAIRNDEIYVTGTLAQDTAVFGYQERWAEYRQMPSRISGMFRSTTALAIDGWHQAIKFTALPTLSSTFILDQPPLSRSLAAGATANGMQIMLDAMFDVERTRPLPTYSIPGYSGKL